MLENYLVDKLLNVMEEEAKIFLDYLDLSQKKKDVLINENIAVLESITNTEKDMAERLGKLEKEREKIIEELAVQANLKSTELTVSSIMEKVDRSRRERLETARNTIKDTVEKIKEANKINESLINNALEYINFSVNLLTSLNNSTVKYGKDGKVQKEMNNRSLFDVKL